MFVEVVFDPVEFKLSYPEFAAASDAALQTTFNSALADFKTHSASVNIDPLERKHLLYLLTAHIKSIADSGIGASGVGRISSATEGSASISFGASKAMENMDPWLSQSQYGVMYWRQTKPYRSFIYIKDPCEPATRCAPVSTCHCTQNVTEPLI